MRTLAERFWAKVDKNGPIPEHRPELGNCWIWTAAKNQDGYGLIGIATGRCKAAHKVLWTELAGLELPNGINLLHRCDMPSCVRLDHLFVGTHADNMRDMLAKGRQNFPSGQVHYKTRMTSDQAWEIRKLWASGVPQTELAARFHRKPNTISKIVNGKLWKSL